MSDSTNIRSGFFWLTSGAIAQNVSKILIIGVLSRLLSSESFGVVTVAATVMGVAELFTQISLSKSLIQLPSISAEHIRTAFTFSLLSSIALFVLFIFAINPIVSGFFEYPMLQEILNVMSLLFPIRGFSQLSFALLQRKKDFKSLAGLEALSYIVGYGVVAVSLALMGYGAWALVYGSLVIGIIYSGLLYYRLRFPISIGIDRAAFSELFSFGTKYSLIKIVNYGALKGDYFIVGKLLGASALGLYSRAYTLMDSVNAILGKVMYTLLFPFFAGKENESDAKAAVMLKLIGTTFNIILPVSVLCFLYSSQIITVLLGNQWDGAILIFRILSISMLARVGYKVVSSFLLSSDTINSNLLVQTLYFTLIVVGTYFGSQYFGLVGASIAVSIVLYLVFFLFMYFLVRANRYIPITAIFSASKKGFLLAAFLLFLNLILLALLNNLQLHILIEVATIALFNGSLLVIIYIFFRNFFLEVALINTFERVLGKARTLTNSLKNL